jgi:C4-dicarboxylate-specific signal transduction histidine kinase
MAVVGTFLVQAMSRRYERQIEAANAELEDHVTDRTRQLSQALDELQAAHERLIQGDKMHLLGELMSGIAHEINNPLTVLQGYAATLADGHYGDAVKPIGERLETSTRRVHSIVENLLAFARNRPPTRRRVSLQKIVQQALDLIGADLRRANISVRTKFSEPLPPLLLDEQQFEQVILNLLNNARHALEEHAGERVIDVAVESTREEVSVSVRDNGPGLAPEIREKLFRPFFTTKPNGNGLGLSLCRRFVEAHGGRIEAKPASAGTLFVIRLPQTLAGNNAEPAVVAELHSAAQPA